MKAFKLIFLLFMIPAMAVAQDDDFETLLGGRKITLSVFGGPLFEFSSVYDNFGLSSGGGGAVIFNQILFIGGYGLSLAPVIGRNITLQNVDYENLEINFGHGGFWFGYIHNFRRMVHFGGSAKFGWGNISLDDNRLLNPYRDNVLVFTPQIEVEVNISRWLKVNLGAGYRIVTGVNEDVFEGRHFNSPQATLGVYVGWFRQRN
ncbi:hypothetical protein BH23BAC1_BH23BAC1_34420 [soil metagenome]